MLGLLGTAGVHGLLIAGTSLLGLGGMTALEPAPVTEMLEVALREPELPRAPEPEPPKWPSVVRQWPPTRTADPPPQAAPQAPEAGEILAVQPGVADFGDTLVKAPRRPQSHT
jgi:hypothetical protein